MIERVNSNIKSNIHGGSIRMLKGMSWIQESKGLTDICKIDILYGSVHRREAICARRQPVSIGYWPAPCDHQKQWSSFIKHPDYIISFFFGIWHWVGKHDHQEEWSFSIFIGFIRKLYSKYKRMIFLKQGWEYKQIWSYTNAKCNSMKIFMDLVGKWMFQELWANFRNIASKNVFHEETTCLWNGLGWGDIEETWGSRRRAPSSPKKRQRGPGELYWRLETRFSNGMKVIKMHLMRIMILFDWAKKRTHLACDHW